MAQSPGRFLVALTFVWLGSSTGADEPKPAEPACRFEVDTTEAPEFADWAGKAKTLCETWMPKICDELKSPGFQPPRTVRLVFKPKAEAIAYASGNTITFSGEYLKDHLDDFGMAIHELTHVVQNYPGGNPGWLVEGIADYVRIVDFEPDAPRPRLDPEKASYRDAYKTTAMFLEFAAQQHDPNLVPKLNRACREGHYKKALFREYTGLTLDELWSDFVATLPKTRAI